VSITLKNNKGSIVAQGVNSSFNVRSLEPGPKSILGPIIKSMVEIKIPKTITDGEYQVYVSVGKEDGIPMYELPYYKDDSSKRYLLGKIIVTK
jgi:hypothetical protein